jgi:hypothetical protein
VNFYPIYLPDFFPGLPVGLFAELGDRYLPRITV